jgi:TetR/AcrR family transcriptional repressor of nem operon
MPAPKDTATRILDVAERLVQVHGFNGFSYADIAEAVGIRKASLHHHFPTKGALGSKLVLRYTETFGRELERIGHQAKDAAEKLEKYAALYAGVLAKGRMCLCGMLAADIEALPAPVRGQVNRFFLANEEWLAEVLENGRSGKVLAFDGTPNAVAKYIVTTLEGAMLVARSFDEPERFSAVSRRLLGELRAKPVKSRPN